MIMLKKMLILALLCCSLSLSFAYSFGQNKVNSRDVNWSMIQTKHFDIYFPKGNDEFGKVASLMAEKSYYYLKNDLQFPATSRIPIVIYGSKTEFQTTNIIYSLLSEGVGGFTESLKNRIAIPFEGSYADLEQVLTHEMVHAYANDLEHGLSAAFMNLKQSTMPFWFTEGLPEFFAVGGKDNYNNMFMLDMVVNDNMSKLDYVDGYLAYRLGESFLTYIAETYGREKVVDYFYALRAVNGQDEATKKIFGMDFKDLESRWRYYLKREYFPLINTHSIPKEQYEQRTKHMDDGSSLNFNPRFAPDGQRYVYFSNKGARYSVWMSGLHGLSPATRILKGESSSKFEEFYYFRSTLSWFPDSRHIALVGKTSDGERIYFYDVDAKKITRTISIPELTAIYEMDVSADGKQLAISAQRNMQSDIFSYDIETGKLTQITNDRYHDFQPRFSPDLSKIAFASERNPVPDSTRNGFFSAYVSNIYCYHADSKDIYQYTFDDFNTTSPVWDSTGTRLCFLSEKNKTSNYEVMDIVNHQRGELTKTLSGIQSGDISPDNKYMLFSAYFQGAWDIYFGNNPFDKPQMEACAEPSLYTMQEDLFAKIDLSELDYYAKSKPRKIQSATPQRFSDGSNPFFKGFEYVPDDSTRVRRDYSWDDKPDSISVAPSIQKYKTHFSLDRFWGGMAYSSSSGAVGSLELGLSDLMGNHAIGINLGITEILKDSNIYLSYLYLKKRADYGIGVYNLYNDYVYRFVMPGPDDYYREREREQGIYLLYRYPFSKFARIDLENRIYRWEYYLDHWIWTVADTDGYWNNNIDNYQEMVYAPGVSLVYDNSLYGSTGPMAGWRGVYTVRKSFASNEMDYLTNYIDLRNYTFFSKRYCLASRLIAGISSGDSPQKFPLGGVYGVRAYDGDLSGSKKVMTSLELRFPLLDYLALSFPIPLTIGGIRGSAFVDAGTVWNDNDSFRGMRDGKLEDLYVGYGGGPRINLGFIVLKLDATWSTDFSKISRPSYYIGLTEDF